jgi:ferrous iron transport protein A
MEQSLVDLRQGEEAVITAIGGGRGLQARLHSMGVVEGQTIRKLSALAWGGPVVVLVKRTQVALGRGMARKILVQGRGDEGGLNFRRN